MWKQAYKGRAASYWFLLCILVVAALAVVLFFELNAPKGRQQQVEKDVEASTEKD
jgi:hypothetical protein